MPACVFNTLCGGGGSETKGNCNFVKEDSSCELL